MADTIIFKNSQITQISQLFGNEIMSGDEISRMFSRLGIVDNSGHSTKWRRLEHSLTKRQDQDNSGNTILRFIQEVLSPVNYVHNPEIFEKHRFQLNKILKFSGIQYSEEGEFKKTEIAKTISDAQRRVQSIIPKLQQRGVHSRVLHYCKEELLDENYFHAILEATKSLSDYVRTLTNLSEDGSHLFDKAFSTKTPYLVLNDLQTESKKNQHTGLLFMLKGINSMVRNVTAHTPKIKWIYEEDEAIDILMTLSFLHKQLDNCHVVKRDE